MRLNNSVPRLYVRIAPSGSKSCIWCTIAKGKRRDIGLGGFPTTSLAEARDEARMLRSQARKGCDPLAERRKANTHTFNAAAERVHREQIIPSTKNGKHQEQWINILNQYVFPVLGEQTVDVITSADVLQVLSKLWVEKPETARRVEALPLFGPLYLMTDSYELIPSFHFCFDWVLFNFVNADMTNEIPEKEILQFDGSDARIGVSNGDFSNLNPIGDTKVESITLKMLVSSGTNENDPGSTLFP